MVSIGDKGKQVLGLSFHQPVPGLGEVTTGKAWGLELAWRGGSVSVDLGTEGASPAGPDGRCRTEGRQRDTGFSQPR